jgi:predicted transcriptional regulator
VSDQTLQALNLEARPYISVRFGVKEDAKNKGDMNLFGKKFGNSSKTLLRGLTIETNLI